MTWLVWAAAALCVGTMGFAIQRGGTCTVAAIDELLTQRSARRLLAMAEASLWVAGGLALAALVGVAGSMPAGFAVNAGTLAGGALLGAGAWLNRACVFGAIARLGSGEWAYVFTPLGFFAGCLVAMHPWLATEPAARLDAASPLFAATALAAPLFVAYALWRTVPPLRAARREGIRSGVHLLHAKVWAPHAATIVIGVTFVATLLLAGHWAYTDVLADMARGMAASLGGRGVLLAALLVGAMRGGFTAGRWQRTPPTALAAARCFGGGALMGIGSLLIPGSNDGLILVGIPLLRPYAWVAFASMAATVALAITLHGAWARRCLQTSH